MIKITFFFCIVFLFYQDNKIKIKTQYHLDFIKLCFLFFILFYFKYYFNLHSANTNYHSLIKNILLLLLVFLHQPPYLFICLHSSIKLNLKKLNSLFIFIFIFLSDILQEKGLWIVKPVASSRGRGIFLINHVSRGIGGYHSCLFLFDTMPFIFYIA